MPSYSDNIAFIRDVIDKCILDEAVEWIAANMSPGEVFDSEALSEWAEENGYTKEADDAED